MKYSHIICHYSEIGLKGRNRPYFVKILRDNIKLTVNKIDKCPIEKIQIIHDRILIILSDYNDITLQHIKKSLSNIFGIAYFCPAIKINDGLDSIKTNALSILKDESFGRSMYVFSLRHILNTLAENMVWKVEKTTLGGKVVRWIRQKVS